MNATLRFYLVATTVTLFNSNLCLADGNQVSAVRNSNAATVPRSVERILYTSTQEVSFNELDSRDLDQREIVPDPDPSVQIIGVWAIPSNKWAIEYVDNYHAMAYPDANRNNTAIVRLFHGSTRAGSEHSYTVIIKYTKQK
jgi:hypothetical protein